MACTNCGSRAAAGCGCAVQAGDNVTITGGGTPADPWVINADPGGGGSTVVTSDDGTVEVTSSTSGSVTTYDLSVPGPAFYSAVAEAGDVPPEITMPLGFSGTLTATQVQAETVLATWDPSAFLDAVNGGVYQVFLEVGFDTMPVASATEAEPLVARWDTNNVIPRVSWRWQLLPFIVEGATPTTTGPMVLDVVAGRTPAGTTLTEWAFSVGYGVSTGVTSDLDFDIDYVIVKAYRIADLP